MRIQFVITLLALFVLGQLHAQELKSETLLTIEDEDVTAGEFLRVYKKNLDLVEDDSQKEVDQYLKLFIDYKLKIKEAEEQGLDTILRFKREFKTYRNQLAKNYLTDNTVTEALVKEAYDRTVEEVNASHILIRVGENASAADTLKAFNKILKLRKEALSGKDFNNLAKLNSEDPSAKQNGGDLGWFSALRMVYEFEDVAYNLNIGEISEPFRTRFGYHILKVNDKRPNQGEVEIAHIMVSPKPSNASFNAEDRIQELYQKAKQGEDFGTLAKQFSDDRNSAREEGKLSRFGRGKLNSEKFEDEAFKIKEIGSLTEPFETQYGWHIVKLLGKYPVANYEEMRGELENKVTKDSRANKISASLVKDLKVRYGVGDMKEPLSFFNSYITDDIKIGDWNATESSKLSEPLLTLRDSLITYEDFAKYAYRQQANRGVQGDKKVTINKWMNDFVQSSILRYHRENLESEDDDFKAVVNEYRDGLLLFDLMEKNIWKKAKLDTLGLRQFYENNTDKYQWNERVNVKIAKVNNKNDAKTVRRLMKDGYADDVIKEKINTTNDVSTLFSEGVYATGNEILPKGLKIKKGISKVIEDDGYFTIVEIKNILPKGPKSLKETKGLVISDYQNKLESEWLASLRNRYSVEVNEDVLQKIKLKLEK